jgi:putative ABC transport system permease protein
MLNLYTIRHALRLLVRDRAFTATAVLTLALGVGANVAIFAVIEAVMLRPLPYDEADRLVILNHRDTRTGITKEFIAIGDYVDLRARQEVFDAIGSFGSGASTLTGPGDPVRVSVLQAGTGLLEAVRVQAVAGRLLEPRDSVPGAPPVALISESTWEKVFGRDAGALGRMVQIGTVTRQIVGIFPSRFRFPADAATEVIIPAPLPASAPANRKGGWVFALARLKQGTSIAAADAQLAALSHAMEREHPADNTGSLYYATGLRDQWLGETKRPLLLMLVAVAVVLVIACANVGNLLLARALSRRHEMGVRAALGAGRGRLVGQLFAESLALSLTAGAAGLLIAYWGVPALLALVPERIAVPGITDVSVNGPVLWYAFAICVASALGFAALSSITIVGERGTHALGAGRRITGGAGVRRAASSLIVIEVALSVILLTAAGLIVRSFSTLVSVDPGFQIERVAIVGTALPAARYREVTARQVFYDKAFAALAGIPGVEAVGAAAVVPLTGNNWTVGFERVDRPVPSGTRPPDVGWQSASGGYFTAMRIPLLSGRLFDSRDTASAPSVVIISQALERQFFPGESAVGRKVRLGDGEAEIIGVVGSIRRAGLAEEPRADLYFPFEQALPGGTTFFVRTAGAPEQVLATARSVLRGVEPSLTFGEIRTMSAVAAQSIATTRLALWLLGIFAAVALMLAAVGIYGVMSYTVSQRAREFGTRVALGATPADILALVLKHGVALAAAGIAIGLGTALVSGKALAGVLYGVSPSDPATMGASLTAITCATLVACYLPARRATQVDAARTLAGD